MLLCPTHRQYAIIKLIKMYLNKVEIRNIRSISNFEMNFENPAGWHVIIGDNGAGKSTIVKSISLGLIGEYEAKALPIDLHSFVNANSKGNGVIKLKVERSEYYDSVQPSLFDDKEVQTRLDIKVGDNGNAEITTESDLAYHNLWSKNNKGYFSCALGPYRRFTGSDKKWDRLYPSSPRADAHKTVFSEEMALSNTIEWLVDLQIKSLERASNIKTGDGNEGEILAYLKRFINDAGLLPHRAKLKNINSEGVFFSDGNDATVDVTQMSDGYRSILSLTFELIRQMVRSYGQQEVFKNFKGGNFTIDLPGIVLVDEIDAHLHPSWQARIGEWFLKVFPEIQFIVTTHSPLICRAAERGTIWRLRAPGTDLESGEVVGIEKERLVFGDLLDAYGTELFGRDVTQSQSGQDITEKLARLNLKSFRGKLTVEEEEELERLKSITSSFSDVVFKR